MIIGKKRAVVYTVEIEQSVVQALLQLFDKTLVNEELCEKYKIDLFTVMELEELQKKLNEAWGWELPPDHLCGRDCK